MKRNEQLAVHIVCSGKKNEFYPEIERAAIAQGVANQIHFIGYVNALELQTLYKLANGLVFPSLFEGWGLPITEAFLAGLPVASSNVTCLPEQAGDAALFFSPNSPEQISHAIYQLCTDAELGQVLIEKGYARVRELTWSEVALNFRALYRRLSGRHLSEEDLLRLQSI